MAFFPSHHRVELTLALAFLPHASPLHHISFFHIYQHFDFYLSRNIRTLAHTETNVYFHTCPHIHPKKSLQIHSKLQNIQCSCEIFAWHLKSEGNNFSFLCIGHKRTFSLCVCEWIHKCKSVWVCIKTQVFVCLYLLWQHIIAVLHSAIAGLVWLPGKLWSQSFV